MNFFLLVKLPLPKVLCNKEMPTIFLLTLQETIHQGAIIKVQVNEFKNQLRTNYRTQVLI